MNGIPRKPTHSCRVGDIVVGGGAPVVVQSMTNTDTEDAASTAAQVAALAKAGSELVRITVNTREAAAKVEEIARRTEDLGVSVPLIGDFHYNGHILLREYPGCARTLAKYRINPGNVGRGASHDANFATMIQVAKDFDRPVRIGVNAGSLDPDLLDDLMDANAKKADAGGTGSADVVTGDAEASDLGSGVSDLGKPTAASSDDGGCTMGLSGVGTGPCGFLFAFVALVWLRGGGRRGGPAPGNQAA